MHELPGGKIRERSWFAGVDVQWRLRGRVRVRRRVDDCHPFRHHVCVRTLCGGWVDGVL